jgi:hypothetical protein
MFVKPATPDLLVANPDAVAPMPRHLPAEGAEVPDTQYWRRRIADGDVILQAQEEPTTKQRRVKED